LAVLAPRVGVRHRVEHLLLGLAVHPRPLAAVPAGPLKHHPALLVGVDRPLHACHVSTPWRRAGLLSQQLLDLLGVRGGERHLASQPPGAPARLVLEQVLAVRATAQHLPGTGQPEALVRSAVRLHLWHARRRLSLLRACGAALSCVPPACAMRPVVLRLLPRPNCPCGPTTAAVTVPPAARRLRD